MRRWFSRAAGGIRAREIGALLALLAGCGGEDRTLVQSLVAAGGEEDPLGEGGEGLHDWVVQLASWRSHTAWRAAR